MTLDPEMAEIAKVFFQESREGLDIMESGLLSLGATPTAKISIPSPCRSLHQRRLGDLGFAAVADFTHGVETLLDEMRNGVRPVTSEAVQTLLQACDCLREMIAATEAEQPLDQGRIASLNSDITNILGERPHAAPAARPRGRAGPRSAPGPALAHRLCAVADLLRLRNEPTRMFAELKRPASLPRARCFPSTAAGRARSGIMLLVELEIAGQIPRAKLGDVFDWVTPPAKSSSPPSEGRHRRSPRSGRRPYRLAATFAPSAAAEHAPRRRPLLAQGER